MVIFHCYVSSPEGKLTQKFTRSVDDYDMFNYINMAQKHRIIRKYNYINIEYKAPRKIEKDNTIYHILSLFVSLGVS